MEGKFLSGRKFFSSHVSLCDAAAAAVVCRQPRFPLRIKYHFHLYVGSLSIILVLLLSAVAEQISRPHSLSHQVFSCILLTTIVIIDYHRCTLDVHVTCTIFANSFTLYIYLNFVFFGFSAIGVEYSSSDSPSIPTWVEIKVGST